MPFSNELENQSIKMSSNCTGYEIVRGAQQGACIIISKGEYNYTGHGINVNCLTSIFETKGWGAGQEMEGQARDDCCGGVV